MAANRGFTREQIAAALEKHGTVAAAARALGATRGTLYYYLRHAGLGRGKPLHGGQVRVKPLDQRPLPPTGQVRRYILTAAQNNTRLYRPVWDNLRALARHYKVAQEDFLCASFTYNRNAYGKLSVKRGTVGDRDGSLWYDPEVEPLLTNGDRNVELAPGLQWCGRMNTSPTAADPLAGFETYTGRRSGVFPHTKLAMRSIASGKYEPTKFNYTTGVVTQQNYIQKAAGLKAEHHHSYGGLLVEVDSAGRWFVRQLSCDSRGRIYDLNLVAEDGRVRRASGTVEAVSWGDVHVAHLDPAVRRLAWGRGGMLDTLRPRYQFLHDVVDLPRNHWDVRDPHKMFQQYVTGVESMQSACEAVVAFLNEESARPWCQSVVVDSNHDNMLDRWLREADYRRDPPNALFFLRAQLAKYEAIAKNDGGFHTCEHVLRALGCRTAVRFLREDESFVILRQLGGIECGQHGHLGPDGARGTPRGLARTGRRSNTCHVHSAGIYDGQFVGGTSSRMDLGYNRGPSSWSHSHVVTYSNGRRAVYTMWDGYWRAE